MSNFFGQLFLNSATILYLFQLLPQLIYAHQLDKHQDICNWFIGLLIIGYVGDLTYAWIHLMPFQYKLVASLGMFQMLIWVQQIYTSKHRVITNMFYSAIIVLGIMACLNELKFNCYAYSNVVLSISRTAFALSWLSQTKVSLKQKTASSLSGVMIWVSLLALYLDQLAAWLLGWGVVYMLWGWFSLIYHTILQGQLLRIKTYQVLQAP